MDLLKASEGINAGAFEPASPMPVFSLLMQEAGKVDELIKSVERLVVRQGTSAPFQFTLPLMCGLYCAMQASVIVKPPSLSLSADEYLNSLRREATFNVANPGDRSNALVQPLRAIAYFSWEKGTRIFLVRRVYPTYFDFLSYSHCPAGWGAVGKMLEELVRDRADYRARGYSEFDNVESQAALPFMQEIKRLKYRAILALPILAREFWSSRRPPTPDLWGALLFFLGEDSQLPSKALEDSDRANFAEFMKNLSAKIANLEEEHRRTLEALGEPRDGSGPCVSLADIWRDSIRRNRKLKIAEISVGVADPKSRVFLEKVTAAIVAKLAGAEFHAIAEPIEKGSRSSKILVAVRDVKNYELLRSVILGAVGNSCAGEHHLKYRFKWLRPDQGGKNAASLRP